MYMNAQLCTQLFCTQLYSVFLHTSLYCFSTYLSLLIFLPQRLCIVRMDNALMTTACLFFPKDYLTNFSLTVTSE